jgi:Na+/phosphate symporter
MNAVRKLLNELFVELLITELVQKEKRLITKWDEVSEAIEIMEQCFKKYLFLLTQQGLSKCRIQTKIYSTFLNCISRCAAVLKYCIIISLYYSLYRNKNSARENIYK